MEGTEAINKLVDERAKQNAAAAGGDNSDANDPNKANSGTGDSNPDPNNPDPNAAKQDEGGDDNAETPEQKKAREEEEQKVKAQQELDRLSSKKATEQVSVLLKKYGFETEEELQEFLESSKKLPKTDEEKKKEADLYASNLNSYAIQEGLMKLEDINKLNKLTAEDDEVLVFEQFADEIREEILEDMPEDASEQQIEDRIKEEFDKAYPLGSSNKKARERAEARLKKAADEIRQPLQSSFNSAKQKYDDELSVRNEYPQYQKAMKSVLDSSVPNKFTFYQGKEGDEEVSVDIEVTEEVRNEILDTVRKNIVDKPETFLAHKKGQKEDLKKAVEENVEYLLWKKLNQEGKKQMHEKLVSLGKKAGSNTGADNSFATNKGDAGGDGNKSTDPKKEAIDSTRKK